MHSHYSCLKKIINQWLWFYPLNTSQLLVASLQNDFLNVTLPKSLQKSFRKSSDLCMQGGWTMIFFPPRATFSNFFALLGFILFNFGCLFQESLLSPFLFWMPREKTRTEWWYFGSSVVSVGCVCMRENVCCLLYICDSH